MAQTSQQQGYLVAALYENANTGYLPQLKNKNKKRRYKVQLCQDVGNKVQDARIA